MEALLSYLKENFRPFIRGVLAATSAVIYWKVDNIEKLPSDAVGWTLLVCLIVGVSSVAMLAEPTYKRIKGWFDVRRALKIAFVEHVYWLHARREKEEERERAAALPKTCYDLPPLHRDIVEVIRAAPGGSKSFKPNSALEELVALRVLVASEPKPDGTVDYSLEMSWASHDDALNRAATVMAERNYQLGVEMGVTKPRGK